jgi:squalene-hopene/tetraprenyl-beta-curcumene cyclase
MLESDYIFMHTLLGTGDRGKMERAVNEILRHQNEDGGWSIYPNGPSNISLRREGYFALKLMGWSPDIRCW